MMIDLLPNVTRYKRTLSLQVGAQGLYLVIFNFGSPHHSSLTWIIKDLPRKFLEDAEKLVNHPNDWAHSFNTYKTTLGELMEVTLHCPGDDGMIILSLHKWGTNSYQQIELRPQELSARAAKIRGYFA